MSNANYNKIKHLVEVDDDTLAVFTVNSGSQKQMENLSIANSRYFRGHLLYKAEW
jgi:hypothetical protein